VPEWLVEYKSLTILLRIVLVYQVFSYTFFLSMLYISVKGDRYLMDLVDNSAAEGNVFYWCLFHTVSAFNNVGYSLQPDSFESFREHQNIL